MKAAVILFVIGAIGIVGLGMTGCSEAEIEELAFRKTLIHDSIELCDPGDEACASAIRSQTKDCMERNDWRTFLDNQGSEAELDRFTRAFYACIVDSAGNPYIAL